MAITNGYATLAEFKTFLSMRGLSGSVGTDTSDDAVIESIIEAVSRYAESQSGRKFWKDSSDTDYYYTACDTTEVKLPEFASITTVAVDLTNTRTYSALSATDWEVDPINYTAEGKPITGLYITPSSSYTFPETRNGVKVTGKRGFPSVPTDIKDATLMTALNIYSSRSGQTSGGNGNVTAGGVVVRPNDVPELAQAIFNGYRLLV